jgi:hypothetical protein
MTQLGSINKASTHLFEEFNWFIRLPQGKLKIDNPEKLATRPQDTQDDEKQNENATQYVLDTTQANTNK